MNQKYLRLYWLIVHFDLEDSVDLVFLNAKHHNQIQTHRQKQLLATVWYVILLFDLYCFHRLTNSLLLSI